MSSILKALKKLEEERQPLSGKPLDMARGLLAEPQRKSGPRWLFPVSLVVVAVIAVMVTFAAMGGFKSQGPKEQPQEGNPSANAPSASLTPTAPPVITPPIPEVTMPVVVPVKQIVKSLVKKDQRPIAPTPPPTGNALQEAPVPATQMPAAKVTATQSAPPLLPVLPARSVPPVRAFTVTGIAWQKDSSSRFAMVNGTPVSKGGEVGSATVVDILPDHVRLSQDGRVFDVYMDEGQGR